MSTTTDHDHAPAAPHEKDASREQSAQVEPQAEAAAQQTNDEPQENARSPAKIAIIMFALGMAVFLAAMDITIITTALPTVTEYFNSAAGYTWIGSAFNLAAAAATPIWGKLSDIFGRKPALLAANIFFLIGSLIAALSINIGMLIVARAIQGVGGGGLIILVNIVISDLFSMRTRGQYFGIIGMVWALASALGPVIGGAFTTNVSWRWCFYINLPLDGLAFGIILFFLDIETPKTPLVEGLKAIDWLGALTVIGGTLMLLLGLEFGGASFPWDSATVICLLIFGAVTIGLFLVIEWKIPAYPIMPIRIFKKGTNLAALAVCFFHGFVFISATYYLPLYFQAVRGASPIMSGVYILAFAVSLSIVSAGTGIFIKKTGLYQPCIWFGLTVMTLGYGLFIMIGSHTSWAKIIIFQIVAGIGVGPNFQSPLIALQAHVNPRDIATATATFGFTRNLATAASVVIGSVVFQNQMKAHKPELRDALGDSLANVLGGASAGANAEILASLPNPQRGIAARIFANSMSKMWIMYTAFAGAGLLVSLLVKKSQLSKQHSETKTGLDNEERKRREALEEQKTQRDRQEQQQESRRASAAANANANANNKDMGPDPEAQMQSSARESSVLTSPVEGDGESKEAEAASQKRLSKHSA
ncbi:putative major facilitator superfamily transporter [Phyllosticta capitalensis]|uniref:Major facilitator superfamily transporter n=2 Tax=Phyllosticta capitalensis TaxID=121624 RepID=A0ABR1YYT1_9PEZI